MLEERWLWALYVASKTVLAKPIGKDDEGGKHGREADGKDFHPVESMPVQQSSLILVLKRQMDDRLAT